ncbi:unnamed protein product [Arctia plantaginis]|uniref:Uncharacterized protein n=1 Tax=Arctia plantaginis TaxID=874455 RepID=A0A8S1ACL7_ARCPL|nr:unnamed protein product [Arctia plantaginis]
MVRRSEQNEKKIDVKVKDRGDSKTLAPKFNNARLKKEEITPKMVYPDGDSNKVSISQRPEKNKINMKPLKEDLRPAVAGDFKPPKLNVIMKTPMQENNKILETEDAKMERKTVAMEAQKRAVLELKRIRQKYALKGKTSSEPTHQVKRESPSKLTSVKSEMKNSSIEPISKPQDSPQRKENDENCDTAAKDATEDVKKPKEGTKDKRKPLIKTIRGKNGCLKAVTFVEQKTKRTVLDINIPNPATCTKVVNPCKYTDTRSLEPPSVAPSIKEKPAYNRKKSPRRRELKRVRRTADNSIHDIRDARSPSTEVAKWAPSSVNQETKPYYEAWVNTRLTAISKYRKNDNWYLYDKAFLKSLKKSMERPPTPDLFYSNFADERYTGRIKIRQK